MPASGEARSDAVGRVVGHLTGGPGPARPRGFPSWVRSGPYLLRPDCRPVIRQPVRDVHEALRDLPPVPGPRTALFVLPFLAVGGAENLLFDLLAGLRDRYRLLVVTLEPHLQHLGQTVDECRALTPWVYTLGDWLPREANAGALRHLLRRYQAESLVCWNGATDFYDQVTALRRQLPGLRILNQLYNHEGGWIEHLGPASIAAIDVHLAVNRRIADALEHAHGVPAARVALVHHGVEVPPDDDEQRRARRQIRREKLGLPQDAVVVGTFVRLHPQKRPLDILGIARRFAAVRPAVHFLLAGGGPLDAAVDQELERAPIPNLIRLPLQSDVDPLYDATDLCLSTSSFEGLPVFLLESLARGIPCVATAVGDVPELLRDGGGVLVERPGDLDALQAGVEALLDPERRRREGIAGRRTVEERFGLGPYRERYERLIFPAASPARIPHPPGPPLPPAPSPPGEGGSQDASPAQRSGEPAEGGRWRPSPGGPGAGGRGVGGEGLPLVSVVVPSYNHGRFLDECLGSVLDSDADLELIVVDDGSTDDSRERLREFAGDPRVRVFEQPNQGAHAALGRGIDLARGEFLFLLNSDDVFEPERIPRFVERFAAEPEAAVVTSWLKVIDANGGELGVKRGWQNMPPWPRPTSGPGLADLDEPALALLETNYLSTTSNAAFRRRLIADQDPRFLPLRYTHDWDFFLAAAAHGPLAVVEEPLVRYRVHSSNTIAEGSAESTGTMRFEILWTVARHARRICRRFEERLGADELRGRTWASLPRFGRDLLLAQLLLLRGEDDEPPPSYDALLAESHPFRRRAIEALA
jgi:glycosyltransferase involved in cell wall biosynthesis